MEIKEKLSKTENQLIMEKTIRQVISHTKSDGGSGIIKLMNPEFVKCDFDSKSLTTKFYVDKWELNPQGSMHGGVICAAFDNTFGMLTHYFANDSFITTVDLATRYLKPIPEGCHINVTAKACSTGRTLVSLTAEAYIEETKTLAATCSSTFMILRNRKTQINTVAKK